MHISIRLEETYSAVSSSESGDSFCQWDGKWSLGRRFLFFWFDRLRRPPPAMVLTFYLVLYLIRRSWILLFSSCSSLLPSRTAPRRLPLLPLRKPVGSIMCVCVCDIYIEREREREREREGEDSLSHTHYLKTRIVAVSVSVCLSVCLSCVSTLAWSKEERQTTGLHQMKWNEMRWDCEIWIHNKIEARWM